MLFVPNPLHPLHPSQFEICKNQREISKDAKDAKVGVFRRQLMSSFGLSDGNQMALERWPKTMNPTSKFNRFSWIADITE